MKNLFFLLTLFIPYACNNISNAQPENKIKSSENKTAEITVPPLEKDSTHFDTLPGGQSLEFSLEYLMGQFDPAKHPDFISVENKYSDGRPHLLRKETYESFKKNVDGS